MRAMRATDCQASHMQGAQGVSAPIKLLGCHPALASPHSTVSCGRPAASKRALCKRDITAAFTSSRTAQRVHEQQEQQLQQEFAGMATSSHHQHEVEHGVNSHTSTSSYEHEHNTGHSAPPTLADWWRASCNNHLPGSGSHTSLSVPGSPVECHGCYELHGPAELRVNGPSCTVATLGEGAWVRLCGAEHDGLTGSDRHGALLTQASWVSMDSGSDLSSSSSSSSSTSSSDTFPASSDGYPYLAQSTRQQGRCGGGVNGSGTNGSGGADDTAPGNGSGNNSTAGAAKDGMSSGRDGNGNHGHSHDNFFSARPADALTSAECLVIEAPDQAGNAADATTSGNGAGASDGMGPTGNNSLHTISSTSSNAAANDSTNGAPASPSFLAQCLLRGAYLELHGGWHVEAKLSPDHMDCMGGSAGSAPPMQSQEPHHERDTSSAADDSDDGDMTNSLTFAQQPAAAGRLQPGANGNNTKDTTHVASAIHDHDGVSVLSVGSFLRGLEASGGAAEVVIVLPRGSVVSHPITVRGPSKRHL